MAQEENVKIKQDDDHKSQDTGELRSTPGSHHKPVTSPENPNKFSPHDLSNGPSISSGLPPELWTIVQSAAANFAPQFFLEVSRQLLENPNLTASYLARAELSYQSFTDATFNPKARTSEELAKIIKHLKSECRPQLVEGGIEGYDLEWTVVRKLIPRNPKLDDALMQTCHLFTSHQDVTITSPNGEKVTSKAERYLVIYIPHVNNPDAIPFYHPKVRRLAMLYTYLPDHDPGLSPLATPGVLSIYYNLFPSHPIDNRLSRTGLKLLEIIHKHSRGLSSGYKKRVHHDQIIPQKRFQDTYAYLKGKYAKQLIEKWVEQTPPEKHVFEDLGITAFLMELWIDMYGGTTSQEETKESFMNDETETRVREAKSKFPGFVDIGCGNGLVVYILNAEGWPGWGFDARKRKTWDTFLPEYGPKLKELLLIPRILHSDNDDDDNLNDPPLSNAPPAHDGVFPNNTFIISNHADELTPWTPLLAYLSSSPFIAIPCCSHDFGGTRFRAPVHAKYLQADPSSTSTKNKQPSAYASLCSWVSHLTEEVGYKVEKEHLRIPSTRNIAVLGREKGSGGEEERSLEEKLEFVRELVEKEMGGATTIEQIWRTWMKNGGGLLKPGKGGH
ncbi:Nn.00g094560.m01.CDS01 [Neocucurbitaria sp. VM-36]